MFERSLLLLVLVATLATPAAAGDCCACATSCAPPVVVMEPVYVTPYYIIDQGPVYSGPGIFTRPRIKSFNRPLADYPYVAQDYPYVVQDYPFCDSCGGYRRR